MKHVLPAATALMLTLTACGKSEPAQVDTTEVTETEVTETEVTVSEPETETVDWRTRYSAEIPYYNTSSEPVMAYASADPSSEVVMEVAEGEGGFIQSCNSDATWCEITIGGEGATGWVDMSTFGGNAQ